MTKKEIVKAISEELGLTQLKTKEIVQKTFDAIVETLVTDRRIELRNFGVFEVKKRAARKARNPRTGRTGGSPCQVCSYVQAWQGNGRTRAATGRSRIRSRTGRTGGSGGRFQSGTASGKAVNCSVAAWTGIDRTTARF